MAEPLAIFNVKPPWYVDHVFCLNTPVHFPLLHLRTLAVSLRRIRIFVCTI